VLAFFFAHKPGVELRSTRPAVEKMIAAGALRPSDSGTSDDEEVAEEETDDSEPGDP
jgi:hypothetical protein